MRKFFGKFVSVTLAAAVIAMFALSSDDKWCSRVDKAFDESVLGSFLNESKAGYGRYATGLPGQAASVLADSGENGENGENGGLAKSSRNTYLSAEERKAALILSKTIFMGQKMVEEGETDAVKLVEAMKKNIETEPLAKIDYIKAVDGLTMQQVTELKSPVLVAMAVYIGKTRLIDNFVC